MRLPELLARIAPLNRVGKVGRVTPCAPGFRSRANGAHGVTRPTLRFMGRICWPSARQERFWVSPISLVVAHRPVVGQIGADEIWRNARSAPGVPRACRSPPTGLHAEPGCDSPGEWSKADAQ